MLQWLMRIKLIREIRNRLWPSDLFRDASKGNIFERAAAYRHNWEARVNLPYYISNWVIVALFTTGMGAWLENSHCLLLSLACWMLLVYTLSELVVLSTIYLVLVSWGP